MKRIEVAVGIVFNEQGHVLVGQRTVKDQYFEKWEFPGGKLEKGESPEEALIREFREEVGIEIERSDYFMLLKHDYPDRYVQLNVRIITKYTGEARGIEGQALKWVAVSKLKELDFLQGNKAMIDALLVLSSDKR